MNVTNNPRLPENIERVQPAAAPQPSSGKASFQTSASPAARPTGSFPTTDQVNFSSVASAIADVLAATNSGSDTNVRWDRIESLQQAIANGSYTVSSTDVAGSLINYLLP